VKTLDKVGLAVLGACAGFTLGDSIVLGVALVVIGIMFVMRPQQ